MMNYFLFDFNGTLLDDVDFCLELLNRMLMMKNHKTVAKEEYLKIFTFPVIEYYKKAGFIFPNDDFESLAKYFFKEYQEHYFEKCSIYKDVYQTLDILKSQGKKLYVVSASEQNLLSRQLNEYHLKPYFTSVVGQSDHRAKGKLESLILFLKENHIPLNETVMIGDTLHDYEIAKECHIEPLLIASGHQSAEVLSTKMKPINKFSDLVNYFSEDIND